MKVKPSYTQTWDGLPVSQEPPFGAAAIIYKIVDGEPLYLILHRGHMGTDYEGRWAWGPPAGARLPNEPLNDCLKRELFEETGIRTECIQSDIGNGSWAVFYAEVPCDTEICLSPEHDKYLWVNFEQAIKFSSPEIVIEQITEVNKIINNIIEKVDDEVKKDEDLLLKVKNTIKKMNIQLNSENTLVYIAGSLAEGFGNVNSDVDIYILCNKGEGFEKIKMDSVSDEILLESNNTLIHNIIDDGIRYDFEYWDWKDVNSAIKKLNSFDFKAEQYLERLTKNEMDFIHRLKHGISLENNQEFTKFYNEVKFENLSFIQVIEHSEQFDGYIEDIEGALISEDFGTVYILANLLLETTISSFLSAHGETNPSRKWLFRKITRYQILHDDKDLLNKMLQFQSYSYSDQSKILQETY